MPQLSDSQLVVLTAACQRPDRCVFPVTARLKGRRFTPIDGVNGAIAGTPSRIAPPLTSKRVPFDGRRSGVPIQC